MTNSPEPELPPELFERAGHAYSQAMAVADPIRLRFWDSRGLTMSQLRLLALIDRGGSPSIGALAEEMNIKAATVSGIADRLERLDFIAREHDPADRRIVRVSLTAEGRRVLSEIQVAARAYFEAIFKHMGPEAVQRFSQALEDFRGAANAVGTAAEFRPD